MSNDGRHPFFDDRRAVRWHLELAPALTEAQASGRRVFVCLGGPKCGGTRALVEKTIWKEEIAEYLNKHFVSVAVDPAHPEPELQAVISGIQKKEPTPLCLYLGSDGHLVMSTVGGRPPAVFLNEMMEGATRK